jgi:CheY-like chemotaxis protein
MEKIKLLMVDDDFDLLSVFKETLEIIGEEYDIMTACDGVEGLKAYEAFSPDVIVTDMEMPKMNGIEMTRKIREKNEKIPIIMLTGMKNQKIMEMSFKSGVNSFTEKPISITKLDQMIKGMWNLVKANAMAY